MIFDVDAGLVTRDGARRYGVVMKSESAADATATAQLRKQMAGERGPKKLFDRGFDTIEELKARCKAETGLDAPVQPQFTQRAKVRRPGATTG